MSQSPKRRNTQDYDYLDAALPVYGPGESVVQVGDQVVDLDDIPDPFAKTRLTKTAFVEHVAERSGLPKADAGRAVNAAIEVIQVALGEGQEVRLPGFGKFYVDHEGHDAVFADEGTVRFVAGETFKRYVTTTTKYVIPHVGPDPLAGSKQRVAASKRHERL